MQIGLAARLLALYLLAFLWVELACWGGQQVTLSAGPSSLPVLVRVIDAGAFPALLPRKSHALFAINNFEVLADLRGTTVATPLLERISAEVVPGIASSLWDVGRAPWVLGFLGLLMLGAAAGVWILRRQVRAKTDLMREWLRREAAMKEQYRDLLENAIDIVYTRDLEGRITSWNNTAERVLGYGRVEALGMNVRQIVAPEFQDLLNRGILSAAEGKPIDDVEMDIITKPGARITVEVRTRLLNENGKPVGVQGIARNVTARKHVEQQACLQAAALEAAAVGIVITNPDGAILWVNPAFTALSGYTLAEVVGKNPRLLKSGKHGVEYYRNLWSTLKSGRVWHGEIVNRRKDGTLYTEELTITPVRGTGGEVTHFVAIAQDITLRRQVEEARAQLAAIVESSHDAITGVTPQGTIISWNHGAEVLYGYRPEEIMGKHASILTPPGHSDELYQLLERVRQGERITNLETVRLAKDGRHLAISLSLSAIKNAHGEVVGGAAIARDITQHQQAEEALRQSEEKFRSIVLNIPEVVWTVDSQGRCVFISPNIERLSGYTAEEVYQAGLNLLFQSIHPDEGQAITAAMLAAFRDQQPRDVEFRTRHKDGKWIWVRARTMGSYEKEGVRHLQGLLADITERKRAEEELALLKHSIDVYSDGAYWTDAQNRIIYVNEAGSKTLGYERGELIGKTMAEVNPRATPESLKRAWEELRGQGFFSTESVHRRKDGSEFPVEVVISYVQFAGKEFACGFARDITVRKRAEEALQESQTRLEAIFDSVQTGIMVIDPEEHRIVDVNPVALELIGAPSDQVIGATCHNFVCPAEQGRCPVTDFGQTVDNSERTLLTAAGERRAIIKTVVPVMIGGRKHLLESFIDITERHRAEEAIRRSETKFRTLYESTTDAVLLFSENGFVDCNQAALAIYGCATWEDICTLHPADLSPPLQPCGTDSATLANQHLATAMEKGVNHFEWVHKRVDTGEIFPADVLLNATELDGKRVIQAVIRDITERKRTEEALRASEAGLAAAQRIAHIGSWQWNVQTNAAHWSDETFRIFGLTPGPLEDHRQTYLGLIHPADRERVQRALTDARNGIGEYDIDYRLQLPDGTEKVIHSQAEVIRDPAGKALAVRGTNHDITARQRAEEALRESEQGLAAAQRIAHVGSWQWNIQTNAALWSAETFRIFGLAPGQLDEHRNAFLEMIHPADKLRVDQALTDVLRGTSEYNLDYRLQLPDGTEKVIHSQAELWLDPAGQPLALQGIVHDITEQKQAEEALRQSEDQYRSMVLNIPEVVWTINSAGRVAFISPNLEKLSGFTPEEAYQTGLSLFFQSIHPDDEPRMKAAFEALFREGHPYDVECRVRRKDGEWIWVHDRAVGTYEKDGVVYAQGLLSDITERKRAEKALQDSEERFRSLVENATVGIYRTTPEGHILMVNPTLVRMLGCENAGEVVARNLEEQGFEPSYPRRAFRERIEREGEVYGLESAWTKRDGTIIHVRESARAIRAESGQVLYYDGIVEDITEVRRAVEAVEESEERFRQLAENIREVFFVMTPEPVRVTYLSPAYDEIWGRPRQEVLDSPVAWINPIHAEDRERAIQVFAQQLRGEATDMEYRIARPDASLRWIRNRTFPVCDAAGKFYRIVGIAEDITERKQVEAAMQRAMQASEEASRSKSEFLANMSHELRTPMNAVIGMTELALATNLNPEQRRYLELAESSAGSLLAMIESILDFSQIEAHKFELACVPFRLRSLVDEALRPLAIEAYRKGLEIAYGVSPTIPSSLRGDPLRLKQILVNLVGNAIKFSERGEVVVRAQMESLEPDAVWLKFQVSDTGVGIPADKLEMVFEAFTQVDGSLTRDFEGTGLGLTICAELVRMMGGRIRVESQVGRGSTFHFNVRLGVERNPAPSGAEPAYPALGGLRVLVVDDHAASREVMAEILLHHGMIPTLAESMEAALEAILNPPVSQTPFHVALVDARLPWGDVFSRAERARLIPGFSAAILLMVPPDDAGHDADRCRELGIMNYLPKPVREKELLGTIASAVEKSATAGKGASKMCGSREELGRVLRVLLVENSEVSQVLVTHLLEKRGHEVVVAHDGKEALAALAQVKAGGFDLALLDVEMPGLSGRETVHAIRQKEAETGGRLPIIAMSAHPKESEEQQCRAADMDGYVAKPLRTQELFEIVQRVVTRQGPVFDKARFLARLEGDELLITEIVGMFLQECPKLMQGVCQAITQSDPHALERAAHTLKGSVADMAAPQAVEAAQNLEKMGREGDLEEAGPALEVLEGAIDRLTPELRKLEKHTA